MAKTLLALSFLATVFIFLMLLYTWPRVIKCIDQLYNNNFDQSCSNFIEGIALSNACAFGLLSIMLLGVIYPLYKAFNEYQSKNERLLKEFSQLTKIFIVFTLAYTFRSAFDIIYVTKMSKTDFAFLLG